MTSRRIAALLAFILVAALAPLLFLRSPAASAAAVTDSASQPVASCDGAKRQEAGTPDPVAGWTPVIFVHGITSDFSFWTKHKFEGQELGSILQRTAEIPGLSSYTFDYGDWSLDWVDNPHIGPQLAKAITCLALASGNKVAVVAHSMGGLATEYASHLSDGHGGHVSDHISTVITLGTPYHGSKLLTAATAAIKFGSIVKNPIAVLLVPIMAGCSVYEHAKPVGNPCFILGVPGTPAGNALQYYSRQVEALSWPRGMSVHALDGEIDFGIRWGFIHLTTDIGDIPVSPDSAYAGGTEGDPPLTHCSATPASIVAFAWRDACYHGNLDVNDELVRRVLSILQTIAPPPSNTVGPNSGGGQTEVVVDVSGSMSESAGDVSKLQAAQSASSDVLRIIDAERQLHSESVGLITFSDDATVAAPLSGDTTSARSALSQLEADGGTNIGAGLQLGLDGLQPTTGSKTIILLTDGEVTEGLSRDDILAQLVPEAVSEDVRIDTVALGDDDVDTDLLQQIANGTGGTYTETESLDDLRQAFVTNQQSSTGIVVASNKGSIAQGQTVTAASIVVPNDQKLLEVSLAWDAGRVGLQLTTPSGSTISVDPPSSVTASSSITGSSTDDGLDDNGFDDGSGTTDTFDDTPTSTSTADGITRVSSNPEVVIVRDPDPGTWHVAAVGEAIADGSTSYFSVASRQTGGRHHSSHPWHKVIVPGGIAAGVLVLIAILDAVVVRRRVTRLAPA